MEDLLPIICQFLKINTAYLNNYVENEYVFMDIYEKDITKKLSKTLNDIDIIYINLFSYFSEYYINLSIIDEYVVSIEVSYTKDYEIHIEVI